MSDDRRKRGGDAHLPASEEDSDFFGRGEAPAGKSVRTPASEEETRLPRETDLEDGRPGRGGPGTIPPPD